MEILRENVVREMNVVLEYGVGVYRAVVELDGNAVVEEMSLHREDVESLYDEWVETLRVGEKLRGGIGASVHEIITGADVDYRVVMFIDVAIHIPNYRLVASNVHSNYTFRLENENLWLYSEELNEDKSRTRDDQISPMLMEMMLQYLENTDHYVHIKFA